VFAILLAKPDLRRSYLVMIVAVLAYCIRTAGAVAGSIRGCCSSQHLAQKQHNKTSSRVVSAMVARGCEAAGGYRDACGSSCQQQPP
jgi:hypothetical protein